MKKHYNCLVLNKLYIPIYLVSWKQAISLLYTGKGQSLDQDLIPYDYEMWNEYCNMPTFDETYYNYVHSITQTVAVPDIIVLKRYAKLPRRDIKYSRDNVFSRDGYKCAYCGKKFNRNDLTLDHIVPKSHGGKNGWRNTISSCKRCNNIKADRTPEQARMPLLFQPKEPRWQDALTNVYKTPNIRPTWSKFLESVGV
jgi:5-methylcytosine-specific restriction endonuclease McrA